MPKVSLAFFATGCVFVLVGMGMGVWMAKVGQFTLSPVHAHINLIGWATMGLMGTFYALAGDRAPRKLAWINYGMLTLGMLLMAPSLGSMLLGSTRLLPALLVSQVLIVGGTLCFLASIVVTWMRSNEAAAPSKPAGGVAATTPAE